jgi:sulfinoalanine decarboxylase/sulfinoalanine decarboxylase/aspartate 1-decarboxylase
MKETLKTFNSLALDLFDQEENQEVAEFIPSDLLNDRFDLDPHADPMSKSDFQDLFKKVIEATPKTASKSFFNQLFGGRNEDAVLGELMAVLLNNSMYTYKVAGPMVGIEKAVIKACTDMIGWGDDADGTFAPGGSMANFMSMVMARDYVQRNAAQAGVNGPLMVYTSKECHYSIAKNAAFSGIGRDQVRYVPVDEYGKLIPEELKKMIKEDVSNGKTPALINATAGTTVMGAFDPIEPLADIRDEFNCWLHVDGAYCGGVIFSEKYKQLVNGLEKADSFCFNAHKMLMTPLSCSLMLVKNKEWLYRSFANDADYLYQTDHDEYNLGKTSLQCGRRNDALKFWTLWKQVGTNGLEAMVNHLFKLADVARDYIRSHPDYTLYNYDDSLSICFNYKDIPAQDLCTQLYEQEKLMVGYGQFQEDVFVRMVAVNAANSESDILDFFKVLEEAAEMEEA